MLLILLAIDHLCIMQHMHTHTKTCIFVCVCACINIEDIYEYIGEDISK